MHYEERPPLSSPAPAWPAPGNVRTLVSSHSLRSGIDHTMRGPLRNFLTKIPQGCPARALAQAARGTSP